LLKEGLTF